MAKLAIPLNDRGRPIGEGHHNARLTRHDADLMRELREEHGLSLGTLAAKFEVSRTTVMRVCRYEIHCQVLDRWKFVEVTEKFLLKASNGRWGFVREVVK